MSKEHCKCLSRHSDFFNGRTFYVCNACEKEHDEGEAERASVTLKRLLAEASVFPLPLRIATKLHLQGVHSEEINLKNFMDAEEPLLIFVMNALRNIEAGVLDHNLKRQGMRTLERIAEDT